MTDREWREQTDRRLTRMEDKLDKLMSFRGWVLGITSAISLAVTSFVTYLSGGFHRGQ